MDLGYLMLEEVNALISDPSREITIIPFFSESFIKCLERLQDIPSFWDNGLTDDGKRYVLALKTAIQKGAKKEDLEAVFSLTP